MVTNQYKISLNGPQQFKVDYIFIPTSYPKARSTMIKIISFALILAMATGYSVIMAHDMAWMSAIAYESAASINAWNCPQCSKYDMKNQKAFFSSVANIQGYAGHLTKDSAILIAFRGSVDFKNWVYNLDTATTSYPSCSGCSVHAGFYTAFKAVWPLVKTEIIRLKGIYPTARIIVTGHSLGGAMAVHSGLEIKATYGKVDYVYTFGQPRVGNANFAAFTEAQTPSLFRVINYADMVPHVPPSAFTFKHGGKEIWYNPRGMKTYKTCISEDKACANSMVSSGLSTDDHSISYYQTLAVNMINPDNLKRRDVSPYPDYQIARMEERRVQQIKDLLAQELGK